MIDRYTREELKNIWSLENKFNLFLKTELAVVRAYNKLGKIPTDAMLEIEKKAKFSIARIDEIEAEVKHDVIAFLTCVNENVGEYSHYIHMGLTSSDVIDTALALQLKQANEIIEKDILNLINSLREKAKEHKETICIGRSHGIHAEPMTFGVKLCNWIDITERNFDRFRKASKDLMVGQISGPVGTYSNIDPEIEKLVCEELGLSPARVSTQIIQRDAHAYYLQTLALLATTIEQFSIEIRHLQKTEVLEVEEGFSKNQKGSSAMPHKKNPISSENLSGLARVVRSNSFAGLENVVLWHERDISHSSAERIILPDSSILVDYMLNRFKNVVDNLRVYPENMVKNVNLYGGVVFSQKVLLTLTEKGVSREDAYRLVQRNAHEAWNKKDGDFRANLHNDNEVKAILTDKEIDDCFDYNYYLRNIKTIYDRVNI